MNPPEHRDRPLAVDDLHPSDVVRLSAKLFGSEAKALRQIAKRRKMTVTDALRQCIATQRWIDDQAEHHAVFILERRGQRSRVVFP